MVKSNCPKDHNSIHFRVYHCIEQLSIKDASLMAESQMIIAAILRAG